MTNHSQPTMLDDSGRYADRKERHHKRQTQPPRTENPNMTRIIVEVPAPIMKPVRRRKTGLIVTPSPWLNVNDRTHRQARAKLVSRWREAGRDAWAAHPEHGRNIDHARIMVYVHRPRNTRADAGNFYPTAKAVIDGMVSDAGMLPDDNDNYVTGPDMRRGSYRDVMGLTVTIEPVFSHTELGELFF